MTTDYDEKWKHAKQVFQTSTRVKKPSAEVDSFFRKPAGIDSTLKKVDAASDNSSRNANGLKAFEQAVAAFVVAKNSYYRTLETAINRVPKGVDHDVYAHGLTVLKTELTALESSMKSQIGMAKSSLANESTMQAMAKNFFASTEGACDRAIAFVAKAKATPTPAYFNSNIVKAARDITQQIGNVDRLKSKGFHFEHVQPTNLFTILKAWGNDGRQVKTDATKEEVLREIEAFRQAVVGVQKWAAGEYEPLAH